MDGNVLANLADKHDLIAHIIISAILIIGGILAWKLLKKAFRTYDERHNKHGDSEDRRGIISGVRTAVKYGIFVIVLLAILQINGINVGGLIASLGITGAVLGLAIQDFLKDIIMGLHIKSDGFFKVGDVIEFDGHKGSVVFFNAKTTKIKDVDTGHTIAICNREFSSVQKISSQVDMDIALEYDEDLRLVHDTLVKACEKIKKVDGIKNCVFKGTQEFTDYCVLYRVRFFCSPHQRPELWRSAMGVIQQELMAADISIARPDINVYQKS